MTFTPPQRMGILFQLFLILLLVGLAGLSLVQTVYASIGPVLLLTLLLPILAVVLAPFLAYRIYALRSAFLCA